MPMSGADIMLDILVCALGWGIVVLHTWALRAHFDMPVMPNGVKVISASVISSAVLLTFLCLKFNQPAFAQWIGLFCLIFSAYLCWLTLRESRNAKLLAAFDEKLPHGLLKTGPYSMVRHPFYTSYLIQWIGWAIAGWSLWGIVPVLLMTTIYVIAARDEEAKFSRTDMAEEYATYSRKTGRFFPRIFG